MAALVAIGGFVGSASAAHASWAATGGQIGIVDTNLTASGTQGATSVMPGINGQAMDDVQLLIPNTFKNGDTIDLAIFDRTATASSNGQINADAAHRLGFTMAPSVTVDPKPYTAAATEGPTSGTATDVQNNPSANLDTTVTKPGTPPQFRAQLVQSSRANGLANDIIRLTVNGVQADSNNPASKWKVTLSGLQVDLGSAVSPGELRVVPFAYDGTPSQTGSNASLMFGNKIDNDGNPNTYDPLITTYTVPAYVAPVTFNVGAPSNIVADGTTQKVGDITIAETNNYSLQNGTYSVTVGGTAGPQIRNNSGSPVTVTTSNAATGETVTTTGVPVGNSIQFTIAGASNTSKLSIKLSGLLLSADQKGGISYTLSGGSIDSTPNGFLVTAGTSGTIGNPPPPTGVYPDASFSTGVNQTDIAPPLDQLGVNASASSQASRIGGVDRYDTAAKIALNNGNNDYVVLASGENFPDALSSAYLAGQIGGGSILLTRHDSLPAVTADTMRLLGTRTVYVVGGSGAVSDAVVAQLSSMSQYYPGGRETIGQGKLHVIRLAGADRYATNKTVNEYAAALSGGTAVGTTNITFGESSKPTALVATGENFADALSAGPGALGNAGGHIPLILTRSGSLSPSAQAQMSELDIQQAVVLGGTGAVSSAVESAISGTGVAVKRIAGANRWETATKFADFERAPWSATNTAEGGLGFNTDGAGTYLANGYTFADALAGAPLAGGRNQPIVLTDANTLPTETRSWLKANSSSLNWVTALGLGGAVSTAVLNDANQAIAGN